MKNFALSAATAAMALFLFAPPADAARWCRDGANGPHCGYASHKQCARRGAHCYRVAAVRHRPAAWDGSQPASRYPMAGQIEPSRPYWSSPYQCFFDDGGGRFRPCDQPSGGGFN